MSKPNCTIAIDVTLSVNAGKPSGYQFSYASDSGIVRADGRIDLRNLEKEDVELVFALQPIGKGNGRSQPTFDPDPKQAIWFAPWPVELPLPAPCPTSNGHPNSAFKGFKVEGGGTKLRFIDKNNDKRRYSYALRCIMAPGGKPVVDDPLIINKIR